MIFAPSNEIINTLIQSLSAKFLLQDEGNVSTFLGVQVAKDTSSKTVSLRQPSLIDQVIKDVGLDPFRKGKDTTCDATLHPDISEPPRQENWNY